MLCPKFKLPYKINYNPRVHICFYFAIGVKRGTSIGGMPQSSKTIAGGPINMAPLK
jgi:hypothetical protein